MGLNINDEVARACAILRVNGVSVEVQKKVVDILVTAGVEHCLNEQQRIREEKETQIAIAQQSYRGIIH